jgi:hypothetical protein
MRLGRLMRQLLRLTGAETPNGVWPFQKCKGCGKLLDPARREPMNAMHGTVCSEECDSRLRDAYGQHECEYGAMGCRHGPLY